MPEAPQKNLQINQKFKNGDRPLGILITRKHHHMFWTPTFKQCVMQSLEELCIERVDWRSRDLREGGGQHDIKSNSHQLANN